jgi:hypothetical protein
MLKKISTTLSGIAMVTVMSCSSTEFVAESNYNVMPFTVVGAGIPVVRATLNDKDAWFIVDTGASVTLLNMAMSEYFNISTYSNFDLDVTEINGLGGAVTFESAICKIGFGQLIINHKVLKSKDLNGLFSHIKRKENIQLAGIIGSDILLRYRMTINYENKTLSYKRSNHLRRLLVQLVLK